MSLKCSRIEICTSRLKKFRWYTATGLFLLVGGFVQWKTYRTFAKQLIKFKNICSEVILAESSDFPMQAKV